MTRNNCRNCGGVVPPGKLLYCCHACGSAYRMKKYRDKLKSKYPTDGGYRKSLEISARTESERNLCLECEKSLEGMSDQAIYCSDACRMKYNRRRNGGARSRGTIWLSQVQRDRLALELSTQYRNSARVDLRSMDRERFRELCTGVSARLLPDECAELTSSFVNILFCLGFTDEPGV